VVDEYNLHVEPDLRLSMDPASTLYGPGGRLDSFGLLDLLTLLETRLELELGRPVALVEAAPGDSPFRTMGSLIASVRTLLEPRRA